MKGSEVAGGGWGIQTAKPQQNLLHPMGYRPAPLPSSPSCARRRAGKGGGGAERRGRCLLCGCRRRRRGDCGKALGRVGGGALRHGFPARGPRSRGGGADPPRPDPSPPPRGGLAINPDLGRGRPLPPIHLPSRRAFSPPPALPGAPAGPSGNPCPPRSVALGVQVSVCIPICPVSPLCLFVSVYPGHLHSLARVAAAMA